MASTALIAAVEARCDAALPQFTRIPLDDYSIAPTPPNNLDEFICTRYVGTTRDRLEVGGDPDAETNAYAEDGNFRIDVYIRVNPKFSSGNTKEARLQAVVETVIRAFLGKNFDNVEIFTVSNGLDLPAGAPPGWWADSISCGFHFESFGP